MHCAEQEIARPTRERGFMKNLVFVVTLFLAATAASGQTYSRKFGGEKIRAAPTAPPHVTQRGEVTGAVPRGVRGGNPLQMLNPLAPAKYGTARQSVMIDPETGKWNGIKLFEIFW
jgi:hypothetical protein